MSQTDLSWIRATSHLARSSWKRQAQLKKNLTSKTRAFLYEELERTRIHCEFVVNEHCAKMSIQGNVMSEDELQAYADIRGAPVKVCFDIDAYFLVCFSYSFRFLRR